MAYGFKNDKIKVDVLEKNVDEVTSGSLTAKSFIGDLEGTADKVKNTLSIFTNNLAGSASTKLTGFDGSNTSNITIKPGNSAITIDTDSSKGTISISASTSYTEGVEAAEAAAARAEEAAKNIDGHNTSAADAAARAKESARQADLSEQAANTAKLNAEKTLSDIDTEKVTIINSIQAAEAPAKEAISNQETLSVKEVDDAGKAAVVTVNNTASHVISNAGNINDQTIPYHVGRVKTETDKVLGTDGDLPTAVTAAKERIDGAATLAVDTTIPNYASSKNSSIDTAAKDACTSLDTYADGLKKGIDNAATAAGDALTNYGTSKNTDIDDAVKLAINTTIPTYAASRNDEIDAALEEAIGVTIPGAVNAATSSIDDAAKLAAETTIPTYAEGKKDTIDSAVTLATDTTIPGYVDSKKPLIDNAVTLATDTTIPDYVAGKTPSIDAAATLATGTTIPNYVEGKKPEIDEAVKSVITVEIPGYSTAAEKTITAAADAGAATLADVVSTVNKYKEAANNSAIAADTSAKAADASAKAAHDSAYDASVNATTISNHLSASNPHKITYTTVKALPDTIPVELGSGNKALKGAGALAAAGSSSAAFGFGSQTTASAEGAFAAGYGAVASGKYGIALGAASTAAGIGSFCAGYSCRADGDYSAVFGKFNDFNSTDVEQVGWGIDTARANIRTLDRNGNETIAGEMNALSFNVTSARKFKENIHSTRFKGLEIINNAEVVDFNYIKDEHKSPKIGLIADDCPAILATTTRQSLDINNCIGVLMKAVQELSSKVKELEDRVKELENR